MNTKAAYACWISFQFLIILGLPIYSFFHFEKYQSHDPFIGIIEAGLLLLFFIEIAVRIAIHKFKFFTNSSNMTDLVTLLGISLICGYTYIHALKNIPLKHSEDVIMVILTIRYLSQTLRAILDLRSKEEVNEKTLNLMTPVRVYEKSPAQSPRSMKIQVLV